MLGLSGALYYWYTKFFFYLQTVLSSALQFPEVKTRISLATILRINSGLYFLELLKLRVCPFICGPQKIARLRRLSGIWQNDYFTHRTFNEKTQIFFSVPLGEINGKICFVIMLKFTLTYTYVFYEDTRIYIELKV